MREYMTVRGNKEDIKLFILSAKMKGWKINLIDRTEEEEFTARKDSSTFYLLFNIGNTGKEVTKEGVYVLESGEFWFSSKEVEEDDWLNWEGNRTCCELPRDWHKANSNLDKIYA